jgi:hypothetical protein
MIFFSTKSKVDYEFLEIKFDLCINDFKRSVRYRNGSLYYPMPPSYSFIFNLSIQQSIESHDSLMLYLTSLPKLMPKVDEAFEKNEWIHAEIQFQSTNKDTFHLYFEDENNADHIQFTNPNSISQSQPLLKKQTLLDGIFRYRTCGLFRS